MGDYSKAAEFYDLLHAAEKDYAREAGVLAALIRETSPKAERVLDVACGTGLHALRLTELGFAVDGLDIEPEFIALAQARCPSGLFQVADMTGFALPRKYHAIVCLFSSIGYVRSVPALNATLARMSAHLEPGGVVIIDPWFEPGQLSDRAVAATAHAVDGLAVSRVSRTLLDGQTSRLDFE